MGKGSPVRRDSCATRRDCCTMRRQGQGPTMRSETYTTRRETSAPGGERFPIKGGGGRVSFQHGWL